MKYLVKILGKEEFYIDRVRDTIVDGGIFEARNNDFKVLLATDVNKLEYFIKVED